MTAENGSDCRRRRGNAPSKTSVVATGTEAPERLRGTKVVGAAVERHICGAVLSAVAGRADDRAPAATSTVIAVFGDDGGLRDYLIEGVRRTLFDPPDDALLVWPENPDGWTVEEAQPLSREHGGTPASRALENRGGYGNAPL